MTHLVIVVPGIMGSELRLDGERVWPGSLLDFWLPYRQMPQLMDDRLTATDVIRSYSVSIQYKALLDDLERCGFRERGDPPTLFVCPYDWRKHNERSAIALADRIDHALELQRDAAEVSLIAHSMGGLVARYYPGMKVSH